MASLQQTPSQTVGPFLALGLPWPDGPFVVPEGSAGAITIAGRVLDGAGDPVPDALVETWQAAPDGTFAHPDDPRGAGPAWSHGFRGFGRSATDLAGRYRIITVKPGPVPLPDGRLQAPHLDVSVFARGLLERVVTRIYFPDEQDANDSDPVLGTIDADRRAHADRRPGAGRRPRRAPLRHPPPGLQGDGVLRCLTPPHPATSPPWNSTAPWRATAACPSWSSATRSAPRRAMWDPQASALARHFRLLRFDWPGHGSPAPPGPYSIEKLSRGVLALMDRCEVTTAAYTGLSLGGMIGMWLAAHAPGRITRLALCCTSARLDLAWAQRAATVRGQGMGPIADGTADRWFTRAFQNREPGTVGPIVDRLRQVIPEGYAGCCDAIGAMDQRAAIASVTAPTLVIAGSAGPRHAALARRGHRRRDPRGPPARDPRRLAPGQRVPARRGHRPAARPPHQLPAARSRTPGPG